MIFFEIKEENHPVVSHRMPRKRGFSFPLMFIPSKSMYDSSSIEVVVNMMLPVCKQLAIPKKPRRMVTLESW
jgi:hypothetical protein